MVTTEQIKALREATGISIAECKKALEASGGDEAKALEVLKAAGAAVAAKKSDRALGSGTVASYIHNNGLMGALIELRSETDFVAKNPDFKVLANDLAMQIAAIPPADTAELLTQPFIKDGSQTVEDVIKAAIQKFGERIEVGQFTRLVV